MLNTSVNQFLGLGMYDCSFSSDRLNNRFQLRILENWKHGEAWEEPRSDKSSSLGS